MWKYLGNVILWYKYWALHFILLYIDTIFLLPTSDSSSPFLVTDPKYACNPFHTIPRVEKSVEK